MRFITFIPCEQLKPFVKQFAISENVLEKAYKVLPDTGVVVGFQFKGKLSLLSDEKETKLAAFGLTGLHDGVRVFKNTPGTGTVLVYFNEAGAAPFFNQPIHEFFRESLSLDNFMLRSELFILEEQLCEAESDLAKINVIEKFLISRLKHKEVDLLVVQALALIHEHKGNIRIKELLKLLHISQSPLEKRFRQVVGTSPKKYCSIIRLKNSIQNYNSKISLTELGYEAGFYDQAHFIKEFRNFTGDTPETFFKNQK